MPRRPILDIGIVAITGIPTAAHIGYRFGANRPRSIDDVSDLKKGVEFPSLNLVPLDDRGARTQQSVISAVQNACRLTLLSVPPVRIVMPLRAVASTWSGPLR